MTTITNYNSLYKYLKNQGGVIMATIKGYKVCNPDWICRGFQYKNDTSKF